MLAGRACSAFAFDANDGFPWLIMDAARGKKNIKGGTL